MDTQLVSNIKGLLQLPGVKQEDLLSIQTGTYEDIHHALYEIQKRLPENIRLDIDNLTANAIHLYPGQAMDGQEQFEAEQRQQRALGLEDAAAIASLPLALRKTSKEEEIADAFDVAKKDKVNNDIKKLFEESKKEEDALDPNDREGRAELHAKKMAKVRGILNGLQREELYDARTTDLIEDIKKANPKHGEALAARIQSRHEKLKVERRVSTKQSEAFQGRTTTPTASTKNYQAFVNRLMNSLEGMSDEQIASFLKKYTTKQLSGTHADFGKLFYEELEKREHLKWLLGKYKRQKRIVSIGDQNKIAKKKDKEVAPIRARWREEREEAARVAKARRGKEQAARMAKFNALKAYLGKILRRRNIGTYVTQTTEETDYGDQGGEDYGGESGGGDGGVFGFLNNLYNRLSDVKNLLDKFRNTFGNAGHATEGLTSAGGAGTAGASASTTVAATEGAAATTPAWFFIAIGLALLFVLVFIYVMIQNPVQASPYTGSLTGTCATQDPATPQGMKDVLAQQFNIHILNASDNVTTDIYHMTCQLSGYKFMQLLGVPKIEIDITQDISGCAESFAQSHTKPNLFYINAGSCASSAGNKFIITHEYGHILSHMNPDIMAKFCTDIYHGKMVNGGCTTPTTSTVSTLPTYNCLYDYAFKKNYAGMGPPPYPYECFSDMVGEFLVYKDFTDRLGDLPRDADRMLSYGDPNTTDQVIKNYYNFAQQYIFSEPNPPDQIPYNGTCSQGIGVCTPDQLSSTFGAQAINASVICQAESASNPESLHNSCQQSVKSGCQEYSVGLFQINMNAHVADFAPKCAKYISTVSYNNNATCGCKVNSSAMWTCLKQNGYLDVSHQESYAVSLLVGNSTHWQPIWSTASICKVP